jgi:phospholipase/carboxylesterase
MASPQARSKTTSAAHLNARPELRSRNGTAGLQNLRVGEKPGALLYAPESAVRESAAPLAVMLHGAGGTAEHGLELLKRYAEGAKLILLAPQSRKSSWDIISDGQYGPDVRAIDDCLQQVFSQYSIDAARVALGGFSDGASYALSLGLSNGQLFRYLLAFSPGFMAAASIEGQPNVFISHGTHDEVLPIQACSRRLVPILQSRRVPVEYREFEGPHCVPEQMKREALKLFLGPVFDSG